MPVRVTTLRETRPQKTANFIATGVNSKIKNKLSFWPSFQARTSSLQYCAVF